MRKLLNKLALILPLAAMAACWHEGQKECDSYMAFTYRYNLPGVEMLHKSVDRVELLLFDGNGVYQGKTAGTATRSGSGYLPAGYTLALPRDEVNVDRIVTLGGDYDSAFEITPELVTGQTNVEDIRLRVRENAGAGGSMPGVFIGGRLEGDALKELPATPGTPVSLQYINEVNDMELMKISNIFRIALKITERGQVQPSNDFTFEITAPNSVLDLNAEPADPTTNIYRPYLIENNASGTQYTAAQIWTPRLKSGDTQKITIREKAAPYTVAFEEDLNELISVMMLQEESGTVTDMQEYLDRKDVFSVVLVLEKTGTRYVSAEIRVNSWIVREEIVEP